MRRLRIIGAALVVVTALVSAAGPPRPAGATTIAVTTTADTVDAGDGVVSLREAIGTANVSPGPDTVALTAGATYWLTRCDTTHRDEDSNGRGDLDVTGTLTVTVDGPPGSTATVHQSCAGRLFDASGPLTLEALTLTGGRTPDGELGAVVRSSATTTAAVTLRAVAILDAIGGGEALTFADPDAAVKVAGGAVLTDSTISGSTGAAALAVGAPTTVERSAVTSNVIEDGPAGGILALGGLTVTDSTISDNSSCGTGSSCGLAGGLAVWHGATIADSTVSGNQGEHAGGVWVVGMAPLVATRTTFTDNHAKWYGGAFYGAVELSEVEVIDNTSGFTGGGGAVLGELWVPPGDEVPYTSTITDSTFAGNQARVGGGIAVVREGEMPYLVEMSGFDHLRQHGRGGRRCLGGGHERLAGPRRAGVRRRDAGRQHRHDQR